MFSLSRAQWGMQGGDLWPLPKHKPLACSRHRDAKQVIKLQTELLKLDCRSGDDTQREADADLPLDSPVAANKRFSSMNKSVFDTYLSKGAERTALFAIHGIALYRSS